MGDDKEGVVTNLVSLRTEMKTLVLEKGEQFDFRWLTKPKLSRLRPG
jgi:hypothetical protein